MVLQVLAIYGIINNASAIRKMQENRTVPARPVIDHLPHSTGLNNILPIRLLSLAAQVIVTANRIYRIIQCNFSGKTENEARGLRLAVKNVSYHILDVTSATISWSAIGALNLVRRLNMTNDDDSSDRIQLIN